MRYIKILAISCAILLLSSCGIFRQGSSHKEVSKEKEKVEVVYKDTGNSVKNESSLEEYKEDKQEDTAEDSKLIVKGKTDHTGEVELKKGLNVLNTKEGGKVYAFLQDSSKISLIVSYPEMEYTKSLVNSLNEVKEGVKESHKQDSSTYHIEYENKTKKDTSDTLKKKEYAVDWKMIVVFVGLLIAVVAIIRLKK